MEIEQRNEQQTKPDESGEELPFSVRDDVRVTTLGKKTGTKVDIVESQCNACSYGRARRYRDHGAEQVETLVCNCCGHIHGAEYDYKP